MWNIENPLQFLKQTREEYYTDDWMLTVKPIYYTTKHISLNEFYSKLFYYWKLIAEIKIINNTQTSFRWIMKQIFDKLNVNYLSNKIDIKQTINSIYLIPKEIVIEENVQAGISFKDILFKDITVVKFLESSFKAIDFLKWNFKWKKNIKMKKPYLLSEDKKETYYFINEKFEKVVEQDYKEIEKNYFLSNKNLKEWFFTFKPENYAIEINKDIFFHSTPFQDLFNFFEQQLIKKWIENYEILLWYNSIWENLVNKSDLTCVELHFLILIDGKINRELAKELIRTYWKTGWVIDELTWEEYHISLLVDKNWIIFTFERKYIQLFIVLHNLIDEYYTFKDVNNKYLVKYNFNTKNFEIIDNLYEYPNSYKDIIVVNDWWNVTNNSCIVYLNDKWELKIYSKLFNNWEITTLERYELDYLQKKFSTNNHIKYL